MLFAANRDMQSFLVANRILGSSRRYRDATQAELYYLSKQYEDLAEWNDKSKPLDQRKPRVVIPLFATAVNALDRFVWGGHRKPQVIVGATRTEDEAESSDQIGPRLDPEDATLLTQFTRAVVTHGELHRVIREASRKAMVTTSAAVIVGVQNGFVVAHAESGKHCTPTWSRLNPRCIAKLEILYQTEREEPQPGGWTRTRLYWYRRVIDDARDVVFREAPVVPGQDPEWIEDPEKTVDHGLGFCPVVWLRTCPDSSDAIDGQPIIDPALYSMLDDINRTVSQRGRAVRYGCDPQPIRRGVPEGQRQDLNKNPGQMWDLPAEGSVEFAEVKGTGAESATQHLLDMRERFLEAVAVVLADPKHVSGKISGVVLEFLHAPMMALATDLRSDLGDHGYCQLIALVLHLIAVVVGRGEDVWIPGADEASRVLTAAQLRGVWLDPPITLAWPNFFDVDVEDQKARVDMANAAKGGGLISAQTATRSISPIFGVEDPDAEQEKIDTEMEESIKGEMQEPDGDEQTGSASDDDGDEPAPVAKKPKPKPTQE